MSGYSALQGYGSTSDDVRTNVDEFIATLTGREREQIDLRRALIESREPSEWGDVFGRLQRALLAGARKRTRVAP